MLYVLLKQPGLIPWGDFSVVLGLYNWSKYRKFFQVNFKVVAFCVFKKHKCFAACILERSHYYLLVTLTVLAADIAGRR